MRIIIEIEDGAVRATREEGAAAPEAVNVGGPPAELLRLLGAQPRPLAGATGSDQGAAVNVGGPPEDLLRALASPRPGPPAPGV